MISRRHRIWQTAFLSICIATIFCIRPHPRKLESLNAFRPLPTEANGSPPRNSRNCEEHAFAIVRCGIRSEADYQTALKDPLIREHYRLNRVAFEPHHIAVFFEPAYMYTSARKKGQIGWVKYRIRIPTNEVLYVVGKDQGEAIFLRPRCGNLVSFLKRFPLLPSQPKLDEMENSDNKTATQVFGDDLRAQFGELVFPFTLGKLEDDAVSAADRELSGMASETGGHAEISTRQEGVDINNSHSGSLDTQPWDESPADTSPWSGGGSSDPVTARVPTGVDHHYFPPPRSQKYSAVPEPTSGQMVGYSFAVLCALMFVRKAMRLRGSEPR